MVGRNATALSVAIASTHELHNMLERLVLGDAEQCGWVSRQAQMLEHWATTASQDTPSYTDLAQELKDFALHIQAHLAQHSR